MKDKYTKITGKIEALGQKQYDLNHSNYSYIRMVDDNKNVRMIKNLVVANTCDSYLSLGAELTVYLVDVGAGFYLYAIKTLDRKIFDQGDTKFMEKQARNLYVQSILCLVIGLLTSILIIGLPLLIVGIFLLIKTSKLKNLTKKENLIKNLEDDGFVF